MSLKPPYLTPLSADAQVATLLALANMLRSEGRSGHALPLLEHLAMLRPDRTDVRVAHVGALGEQGRTLEALDQLLSLRLQHSHAGALLPAIQAEAGRAIEAFNGHVGRGEVEAAERYASALAKLLPENAAMLAAAMSCNEAMGRLDDAQRYAQVLVGLDPEHVAARTILAEAAKRAGAVGNEVEHRAILALSPQNEIAPLIRLRDLHDVAGLILCRPLTPKSMQQLAVILDGARRLHVTAEPGTEWEAWANHYRLLIESLDMDLALAPPKARLDAKVSLASSTGAKLDWAAVKKRAEKLGAEAIFFAAADEAYIELYARWFALSVRRYCDVPFLVVVHVIGGEGQLKRIAAKVGIDDERLIFTADAFDAAAVTTACWDAPPKGRIEKPVAHLQSARFQLLGTFLKKLARPVFVSDIDLILQRGVSDLLANHAGADLVLNENEVVQNAGSRITANLLLAYPTTDAHKFLDAVAGYLDDRLARDEVTRWIDQVALTLGRHNLQRNSPEAKIGYFDTSSDINNVMYPSFQEHPFRFLSLFHGFDTSSLEDPRVLDEEAQRGAA
jgi:tetratricopeptide (TPR) repeat protein